MRIITPEVLAYRELVRQFMVHGDVEVAHAYVHPDVVSHSAAPGQAPGLQGMIDTFDMFRAAFRSFYVQIQSVVSEISVADSFDDMSRDVNLHAHCKVSGEFVGDHLFNLPANGSVIMYDEFVRVKFHKGMIVEHWSAVDTADLMAQLTAPAKD